MNSVPRSPNADLELPPHLVREPSPADRSSDIRCRDCRCWITVGPEGTEFGHARWRGRPALKDRSRCPHRPDSVEPSQHGPTPDPAPSSVRDGNGRFCGVEE